MPPLSIVELYGALLFRKLLVQHGRGAEDGGPPELDLGPQWVRLSAQRALVDQGRLPMPIYTAVRHFLGTNDNDPAQAQSRRYEWFELSPYEVGSIDHGAWVASWAFGRPMAGGREQLRIGEAHFGSILGAVSSAFCASAKAMVMELYLAAPAVVRATMDVLLDRIEDGAEASHPIAPYTVHNPFHGAGGSELGELAQTPFLSLMDAGLENNLPFAPLLRPERGVDVIVCLDASANIELMPWFARAEAWAASHGVTRWPWGARPWAADPLRPSRAEAELDRGMLGGARSVREHTARQLKEGNVRCAVFDQPIAPSPLGHAGSVSEPPVTVVYLPLLPNEHFREPAFDPERAAFCATFNDRWTGEQVDRLADLASHNLGQEMERVREAVATAYRRKRAHRLCREQAASHGSTGFS
ncbi:hypothetical protein IWQ56_006204 [Coemansia nantahalensis]|nr:hypothetical protein IWQ56_006204 [Coemansia nantahalensis]